MTDNFTGSHDVAAGGGDREDKTKSAGLRVTYDMRRWLKAGAEYTYTQRNSNDSTADYGRNQLMLFLSGTL